MRFALCLKGAHSIQTYCTHGFNDVIKASTDNSFRSIKEKVIDVIKDQGHELDIFISTFDCDACDYLIELYKPVSYYKFDRMYMSGQYRFISQANHYLKLIELINSYETNNQLKYDIIITVRFDIIFNCPYNKLPISYDKFNITFKHTSGNCDDNLWIFPRIYFNSFRDSCNDLMSVGTTHAMCHLLEKYKIPIHYFYDLNIIQINGDYNKEYWDFTWDFNSQYTG